MKTVQLVVSGRPVSFGLNSQAPFALAVMQVLHTAHRQNGLTVDEIIDKLSDVGVIQPGRNEKGSTSNLLQKLIHFGALTHPAMAGGSRRYILKTSEIQMVI
jgi:hypothetical protein